MRIHVNMAQVTVCVGFMLALAITCEGSSFLPIPPYNDNHPRQLYKHHKPFHGTMTKNTYLRTLMSHTLRKPHQFGHVQSCSHEEPCKRQKDQDPKPKKQAWKNKANMKMNTMQRACKSQHEQKTHAWYNKEAIASQRRAKCTTK